MSSTHPASAAAAAPRSNAPAAPAASSSRKPSSTEASWYGHETVSRTAAAYITHLFSCPNLPPLPPPSAAAAGAATGASSPTARPPLANFVAYALHRTKLPHEVTTAALVLLARLKRRFPAAKGSSGHRLFISAFMMASKVICDDTYSNKSWTVVGQGLFGLSELNQMERELAGYLEWVVTVEGEEVVALETLLENTYSPAAISRAAAAAASPSPSPAPSSSSAPLGGLSTPSTPFTFTMPVPVPAVGASTVPAAPIVPTLSLPPPATTAATAPVVVVGGHSVFSTSAAAAALAHAAGAYPSPPTSPMALDARSKKAPVSPGLSSTTPPSDHDNDDALASDDDDDRTDTPPPLTPGPPAGSAVVGGEAVIRRPSAGEVDPLPTDDDGQHAHQHLSVGGRSVPPGSRQVVHRPDDQSSKAGRLQGSAAPTTLASRS